MDAADTDRFHAKQGRSTGRWILQRQGERIAVYLKRHYQLPLWRGVLAALFPSAAWSPAMQEWQHLQWAESHGLPVPRSLAVGERIGPWGRLQSFLAVEELRDMLPLHEAIPAAELHLVPTDFAHWKKGLILEVARLARQLHERRHFHKDLYLCHFYVPDTLQIPSTWKGRVHLIDLHRLGHHPFTWWYWQVKDLAELLYSSEVSGVTPRDRVRFWRAYIGPGREARLLRGLILLKWRRYRHHNQKKKSP
jgi:heptose I phosphotransferase